MKFSSFSTTALAALAVSWFAVAAAAADATSEPILTAPTATPTPITGPKAVGCFKSQAPLIYSMHDIYGSSGACLNTCTARNYEVVGLGNGTDCYCGHQIPAQNTKVDLSQCNTKCPGYPDEYCGSANTWTIWTTGVSLNQVEYYDPSSASSSTTSAAPSATSLSASSTATSSGSKSSPVGIVVGVIVAIVVVGLLAGGAFFFFRKRQHEEMEEFKKNSDITSFVTSGASTAEQPRPSMWAPDQRMNSSATPNRVSTGSIADNQDYSRRILQVRNPDSGF